jgi:hypothetical protein
VTQILGGPIGPDGLGGAYQNLIETDRAAWWHGMGGHQGVLYGFVHSQVPGSMQLSFTAGAALLAERDGSNNLLDRGYLARAESDTVVTFGAASASNRNDAVVIAIIDTEDGDVGTGALAVGAHIVVVPGVSGTTTPRTDTHIKDYLGRGGWIRLLDVPIASGSTQIATGTITNHNPRGGVISSARIHATATSFTNGVTAVVPYDTAVLDEIPWDSTNKRFTVPTAGYYQVNAGVHFSSNATGYRVTKILVNGVVVAVTQTGASSSGGAAPALGKLVKLAAGDTVAIHAAQGSGGTLALTATTPYNYVDITRVG